MLIFSFSRGHAHHEASLKLFAAATRKKSACALHALAEVYATMTALPVMPSSCVVQAKVKAETTWNLKHFRAINPHLATACARLRSS